MNFNRRLVTISALFALAVGFVVLSIFVYQGGRSQEGLLSKASQDPENEAYNWSIHELLLTPLKDSDSIRAYYDTHYEEYVQKYSELSPNDPHWYRKWIAATGENGVQGYVCGADLDWPGPMPLEEEIEFFEQYRGQCRAIPVFDLELESISDYFLLWLG